jgi:hypothetical protein
MRTNNDRFNHTRLRARRLGPTSGNILLLTMLSIMVLSFLLVSVLTVTNNSLNANRRLRLGVDAFNIAETGVEEGVYWLRNQSYPPTNTAPFNPFGGAVAFGDGTYSVIVTPDPGNPAVFLKTYTITSTGTAAGQSKKVEVVVKQASFGRFAYFTDKETSNVSGGAIWWKAGEVCDGPAHSNNTSGSNFQINYNGSSSPIFRDVVTGAGSTINYSPSRPTTEATYKKVYLDGSKGYLLGVPRIELPPSTDAQKNAAWGASSGFPTSDGVYLRASNNGSLYIVGDAAMQFGVDGSGNQTIKVTQGAVVTTVTVNLSARTMSATGTVGSGSPTSCTTLPNGVIYCTGNVTSLKGTIADNLYTGTTITARSAWTLATDVNGNKDITITDNLKYKTRPNKTLSPVDPVNLAAGTLGLVSRDIDISTSAPTNLEINAVCMAGGLNTTSGSFSVTNYDSRTPVGTLTVLGGIIQKARGAVGTFNASTGQTQTGYSKNYSYDPRLGTDPPPFYPTTGTYERLSWMVVR